MTKKGPKNSVEEDRETRIQKLKKKAEELTGGQIISVESDDCPPEIEEQFLEHVVAFEQSKSISPFEMLLK